MMTIDQMILIIVGIWLLLVTGGLYFMFMRTNQLVKGVTKGNLIKVLEAVKNTEKKNTKSISAVEKRVKGIEKDSLYNVQKVGLIRFNPFSETGGDHSFSLSLLDGKDDGLVITGLHTRERTRLYVKPVKKGKSNYELSKEEKKAILKAVRKK